MLSTCSLSVVFKIRSTREPPETLWFLTRMESAIVKMADLPCKGTSRFTLVLSCKELQARALAFFRSAII